MIILFYNRFANLLCLLILGTFSCKQDRAKSTDRIILSKNYYFSNNGNDNNDGTIAHPWKSIVKLNSLLLKAGDSILLQGGHVFQGTLIIHPHTNGTSENQVVLTSFGSGIATLNSINGKGLVVDSCTFLHIKKLKLSGSGRKDGNTTDGLIISNSRQLLIDSLEVYGYRESGLTVNRSSEIRIQNVYAHDNGFAGISVNGKMYSKKDCRDIEILHCRTNNNPGDPTELNNHSGSGIIVSQCTNLKIAYCTATNNGWDMPRKGNGPVGIWAWDADSIVIEHCLSYRNKTSKGGGDGGGFDLDGGVTNSVIQHCLSYENQGSGFGIFQFTDAGAWNNNTVRFNISINDGNVTDAGAGMYIWNNSKTDPMKNCFIYNNTFYNTVNAAISFSIESANEGFVFYNNILAGKKEIISGGNKISGRYLGNCWWSFSDKFNVQGVTDFNAWAHQKKQELIQTKIAGININPDIRRKKYDHISSAEMLETSLDFKAETPALLTNGIDIQQLFGINTGGIDMKGNKVPPAGIGARF